MKGFEQSIRSYQQSVSNLEEKPLFEKEGGLLYLLKKDFPGVHLLKKHGKSFYMAQFFLSQQVSAQANDLYETCRILDDIADNAYGLTQEQAERYLSQLQLSLEKSLEHHSMICLSPTTSIHTQALVDLIEGLKIDQCFEQFCTLEQLLNYCYYVAGSVGLMMCDILQVNCAQARAQAIDLGIAMQLTNIARDIYQDAKKLSRIYIPKQIASNLTLFDITHPDLNTQEKIIKSRENLLSFAEYYYQRGLSGLKSIRRRERCSIYIASCLYRHIGHKILEQDDFTNRAYLSLFEKIILSLKSVYQFYFNHEQLNKIYSSELNDLNRTFTKEDSSVQQAFHEDLKTKLWFYQRV